MVMEMGRMPSALKESTTGLPTPVESIKSRE
jgi:hypothetical protein